MSDIHTSMSWRCARVIRPISERDGAQEWLCELPDGRQVRALAYTALLGHLLPADRVLINAQALDAGLGTGGLAFVAAPDPERLPVADPANPDSIVKARYMPEQVLTRGIDEQSSPFYSALEDADSLSGAVVVAADLHSSLIPFLAGLRSVPDGPDLRVSYVMSDGGALPLPFSKAVFQAKEAGWLRATVTCGQAWGGDLEAITVHSALLAARIVQGADVIVVIQGPGNLGGGTSWGFSGLAAGEVINAASTLQGRPVGLLRVSGADTRERHRGLSHHSITAYGRAALREADLVLPAFADATGLWGSEADRQLYELDKTVPKAVRSLCEPSGLHRFVSLSGAAAARALSRCELPLSTMGRGLAEDPGAFLAAASAGEHAANLALRGAQP